MNLVWHIVKKDLRALRWPLVVWAALIAAKLMMGLLLLTSTSPNDQHLFQTLDALAKLLAAFECLGVVLVAALVQEDLLVGTTAFWTTRPISGGRLLAAKLLGLGVIFGVIPVLVTVPWWLACQLDLGTMCMAALETLALQLLVVILGLACAVVTDGLGRFFLWLLAFLAAIPLAGATVAVILQRMNAVVPADLGTTRVVLGVGVLMLTIAGVVGHQYLTRRTWRSIGMIVGGIAVVMLIELLWPWSWHIDSQWNSFLARRTQEAWPAGAAPAGLTFTADRAELRRTVGGRPDRPAQLRVNCHAEGIPPDQMFVPAASNYSLRWADGVTDEGWTWFQIGGEFPELLLPLPRKPGLPSKESPKSCSIRANHVISAKIATRLARESAAYTLQARFSLVEAGTMERVPVAPGKRVLYGSMGERIAGVEKEGESMLVTFVRHRPALISDYLAEMGNYVLGSGANWSSPTHYLLVNPEGKVLDRGVGVESHSSRVASVEVRWETTTYRAMPISFDAKKPRWEAIKALEEAELSRVTYRSLGSFAYELKVDPLVVVPGEGR